MPTGDAATLIGMNSEALICAVDSDRLRGVRRLWQSAFVHPHCHTERNSFDVSMIRKESN